MLNRKTIRKVIVAMAAASLVGGVAPAAARIDEMHLMDTAPVYSQPAGAALFARLRQRPAGLGLDVSVPPRRAPDYNVFGSVVVPVGALPAFDQWERIAAAPGIGAGDCSGGFCATATGRRLAAAARAAADLSPTAALRLVNRAVNASVRYRSERGDHWAGLAETAVRGTGDCEDYAIAKMALLRGIGFAPEALQFVVLEDVRRQAHHAVLAVHVDGRRYILDNLRDDIASDRAFRSYVPIVSFTGERSFIHGFAGGTTATAAALGPGGIRPGEGG